MQRYKLLIEFDGTDYAGWQRQKDEPSVQAAIEGAIKGFSGEDCHVYGAGRTDAGVHGIAMAAHVDILKTITPYRLQEAINFHLKPQKISILAVKAVSADFHARFSCIARHYLYRIINRRAPLALDQGQAWRISAPLDAEAMNQAAQILVGQHDFTTFRASLCQAKSPIKTLDTISVMRTQVHITIECSAPSFLHNQVRSIVGSLVEVGRKKWSYADMEQALIAKERAQCGPVAPAHGLYFKQADYA